jgi:hypothetical protein
MAKVFPILTRIINFIVIFFLIVASVSVFQNNVCRYDTNAFNQIMFYPTITAFTVFVGLSWIFTCVFGVFFQLLVRPSCCPCWRCAALTRARLGRFRWTRAFTRPSSPRTRTRISARDVAARFAGCVAPASPKRAALTRGRAGGDDVWALIWFVITSGDGRGAERTCNFGTASSYLASSLEPWASGFYHLALVYCLSHVKIVTIGRPPLRRPRGAEAEAAAAGALRASRRPAAPWCSCAQSAARPGA